MCIEFSNNLLKARKQHKCIECGCKINSGDHYWRYRGLSDGSVCSVATCIPCELDRKTMYSELSVYDFPVEFGSMGDWWSQAWDDDLGKILWNQRVVR